MFRKNIISITIGAVQTCIYPPIVFVESIKKIKYTTQTHHTKLTTMKYAFSQEHNNITAAAYVEDWVFHLSQMVVLK